MLVDFSTLSADTAHRFRAVAKNLLQHTKEFTETPSLLDVGGYPGTFVRAFGEAYPRWKGMTVDVPEEELTNYRASSGMELPFEDEAFDAVVSIDTFEHIRSEDREKFLSELCRVSANTVVLAAPFRQDSVALVERMLDRVHQEVFEMPHPWLHEHVEFGLPDLESTLRDFPESHGIAAVEGSYELQNWVTWQALSLLSKLRGELDNAWKGFETEAAAAPTPIAVEVPYRWIIVAKRGAKPITLPAVLTPPSDAGGSSVELARYFCRMLQLDAGSTRPESQSAS